MVLGQIGKEAERVLVLILGRPIEANHNLREIGNRFQLLNDGGQRGCLNLRVQRRQYQAQRASLTELQQVLLQLCGGALPQVMQRSERAVLIKVGHGLPPLPLAQ